LVAQPRTLPHGGVYGAEVGSTATHPTSWAESMEQRLVAQPCTLPHGRNLWSRCW